MLGVSGQIFIQINNEALITFILWLINTFHCRLRHQKTRQIPARHQGLPSETLIRKTYSKNVKTTFSSDYEPPTGHRSLLKVRSEWVVGGGGWGTS